MPATGGSTFRLSEQRGKKFDPRLVDILFSNWERAEALRRMLPD